MPDRASLDIGKLNSLYHESEQADHDMFSEMRSNIQLSAGEHYTRRASRFWSRIRDSKGLTNEQRMRLTKNHLGKIVKSYVNNITTHSPGVSVTPKNEQEIQDQKAAEQNQAVWQDIKHRHNFRKKDLELCKDFIEVGECILKVSWDPTKGHLVGFEAEMVPATDPLTGEPTGQMVPLQDPATGQPVASKNAVFSGDFVFERILGFNLLRHPAAKNMNEAIYLIHRKMVPIADLKAMIDDEETKIKITEASRDIYTVFEGNAGDYRTVKDMTMVREYYFRQSVDYPNGYYYITTENVILWEGELPYGVYPIIYEGFDEISTTPRHRSIIKQIRPIQAECNRAFSKIAEHQITLGDDKILYQAGSKFEHGAYLPGVRGIKYSGMPPTFLPGRTGEHYVAYAESQVKEMYQMAGVQEDLEEKKEPIHPYSLLFRSLKQKKRFSIYSEKFQGFQIKVAETVLELAQKYYTEHNFVHAVGRNERVNIAEFKSQEHIRWKIKVEPQVNDIESKMGKQLALNHILQYAGSSMSKDDIGKIMRVMPYTNNEEIFKEFTQDWDNVVNDILALDRGEPRPANKYDDHKYIIKKLISRVKQSDFKFLSQEVQQLYTQKIQEHEMIDIQQMEAIQAAKDGFLPTGGYLVTCDFYVPNPDKPGSTKRAKLPYESLKWLIQKLEKQGSKMEELEQLQQGALFEMATMMLKQKAQPQLPPEAAAI